MTDTPITTDSSTPSSSSMDFVYASSTAHRLMFVILSCLSFCLFAPTVLLPTLREYCELLAEEARLIKIADHLDTEIHRQDNLLEDFAQDVSINERLAILDLKYKNPDEEVLPVLPEDYNPPPIPKLDDVKFASALMIPQDWPKDVRRFEAWGQRNGLIDLFLDRNLRQVFLLMAGGLLVAAFVLFAPRRQIVPTDESSEASDKPSMTMQHSPA